MAHEVVHFEIAAPDVSGATRFYSELLGWKIAQMEGTDYYLVDTQSTEGIGGGITKPPEEAPQSGSMIYVSAPDCQTILDKAESLGGKALTEVIVMPDIVTFAVFADPQGNATGVVLDDGKQPEYPAVTNEGAPVQWFEIAGTDGPALQKFYSDLFGWKLSGDENYGMLETAEKRCIGGGIYGSPDGKTGVTVYARVDDAEQYLKKAEAAGATITEPAKEVEGMKLISGTITDPQGVKFGIFNNID